VTSSLRPVALGGLALGAVLALVAGSRAWWRAAGAGVSVAFTGTEATAGLAQALALVALAGALLALVLRARGRRVLGVLLVLAGAGGVVLGLTRPRPASGAVQSRVLEVSLADQFALVGTPWPYVYAVAALVVVAAAVVMVVTARRWPSRPARFERPGAGPGADPTTGGAGTAGTAGTVGTDGTTQTAMTTKDASDDPAALWRLLDAGVDPTAGDQPRLGGRDEEHIVQPHGAGATNPPPTTGPPERVDVHDETLSDTMRARAAARDDQPT